MVSFSIGEPRFSNKLSLGSEAINRVRAKDGKEFLEQCNALAGLGMPFFREKGPEHGKGYPLMHHR